MRAFETIINDVRESKTISIEQLETLARIFAFNALNRCINPTRRADVAITKGSKKYHSVYHLNKNNELEYYGETTDNNGFSSFAVNARRDMMEDNESIKNMNYWNDTVSTYYLNSNDTFSFERNDDFESAVDEYLIGKTLGDSVDFVNQAIMLILEYLDETDYDLTTEIEWKKADKHIVQDIDYVPEIKTEMISATLAITRKMRDYVEKCRSSRYDETSKYSYVQIDETNDIYFRTGKYADIGGYEQDINGNTWYTTELGTVKRFERQKKALYEVLSPAQKDIMDMRLKGYSIHHIAKIRGCKQQPIQNQLKRIAEKAEKIGLIEK